MIVSGRFIGAAALVGLVSLTGSAAWADVKLVQTVTVKSNGPQGGGRNGNQTVSTTAYYKGNKYRADAGKQIVIMDGDSKQMYTINPAQKTYQVSTLGAMPQTPFMDMMKFDTKLTITPTGRTKTIAGKLAKCYNYNATIKIGMNAKGQQMMKAQGAPANAAAMFPTLRLNGETWATEAIQVPPVAAQAAVAMLRNIPGMQDFGRKMGQIKGLPLEQTTNMTMQGGMASAAGGGPGGMQFSSRTVTTQLSQAPLSAALFTVPAGYRKVSAPAMPGMGGMGRPGGARPQ